MRPLACVLALLAPGCTPRPPVVPAPQPESAAPESAHQALCRELSVMLERHVARVAPLHRELNLAYWEATANGKTEAFERVAELEARLRAIHVDAEWEDGLARWQAVGPLGDVLLDRQLEVLRLAVAENRIPALLRERLVELGAELERRFFEFRPVFEERAVGDQELLNVLRNEPDGARRRAAWEAFFSRGQAVAAGLRSLVRLRNLAARELGQPDYYEMALRQTEVDPVALEGLVDELARRTDTAFGRLKAALDEDTAARFGIPVDEVRPWHYEDPFLQQAAAPEAFDLDAWFGQRDPQELAGVFLRSIGFDPAPLWSRSDLAARAGKSVRAYCLDVDRAGDIRLLAALQPGEGWTSILLHEAGHALVLQSIDRELPWLLRVPVHSLVSEAVAALFGGWTREPLWLSAMLAVPADMLEAATPVLEATRRAGDLLALRFALVLVVFEREMYRNPEQDLEALWWRLRERFQGLRRPEGCNAPDWAAKLHLVVAPAHYHNYLLALLLRDQLRSAIERDLPQAAADGWVGQGEIGRWLMQRLASGASLSWEDWVVQATGRPLEAADFLARLWGPEDPPDEAARAVSAPRSP